MKSKLVTMRTILAALCLAALALALSSCKREKRAHVRFDRVPSSSQPVIRPIKGQTPPSWVVALPKKKMQTSAGPIKGRICGKGKKYPDYRQQGAKHYERPKSVLSPLSSEPTSQRKTYFMVYFPKSGLPKRFNLWINFHGVPFTHLWMTSGMRDTVYVTMDLKGFSDVYAREFPSPSHWKLSLDRITRVLASHYDVDASQLQPNLIGLSGWSAGCDGGIKTIVSLKSNGRIKLPQIDTALCLDGLHGGYSMKGQPLDRGEETREHRRHATDIRLGDNVQKFARRSADGGPQFIISHSSIDPEDYASTTTIASYLIWWVGGQEPEIIQPNVKGYPYTLWRTYHQGNFHVFGFRGGDEDAHCASFDIVPDVIRYYVRQRGFQ